MASYGKLMAGASTLVVLILQVSGAKAEVWKKRWTVGQNPEVVLSARCARVKVLPSDGSAVDATVDVGSRNINVVNIQDRLDSNRLELQVKDETLMAKSCNPAAPAITILVPAQSSPTIRLSDGELTVGQIRGALHLELGSGDATVSGFGGAVSATVGSGRLEVTGELNSLQVSLHSGSATVRALQGSSVTDPWSVGIGSGLFVLHVPSQMSANLSLSTGSGGIEVEKSILVHGAISSRHLEATLNAGGGLIKVNVGSGGIRVAE